MNEIEQCDLTYKEGIVTTVSERELSLMTVRNDITNFSLPFMNGVSMRFSKQYRPTILISHPARYCPVLFIYYRTEISLMPACYH